MSALFLLLVVSMLAGAAPLTGQEVDDRTYAAADGSTVSPFARVRLGLSGYWGS